MPTPLFMTEAEVAKQIGITTDQWKLAVLALEKSGLPLPDPLFGNKRYWAAVKAFLDRQYGLNSPASGPVMLDGEENWGAVKKIRKNSKPITN